MENKDILLTVRHLTELGYTKDRCCAPANNRYEKRDGETHFNSSYWISVTFSEDGGKTLYGIVNFYSSDGNGYITSHRSFEGEITVNDFEKFVDRKCAELPDIVKEYGK